MTGSTATAGACRTGAATGLGAAGLCVTAVAACTGLCVTGVRTGLRVSGFRIFCAVNGALPRCKELTVREAPGLTSECLTAATEGRTALGFTSACLTAAPAGREALCLATLCFTSVCFTAGAAGCVIGVRLTGWFCALAGCVCACFCGVFAWALTAGARHAAKPSTAHVAKLFAVFIVFYRQPFSELGPDPRPLG